MIKFKYVSLKNFRSYKEITTFLFSKNSFNLIMGKNGHGKSSIFRALIWCLLGTDSEGIKGNNLKSWDNKGSCYVEVSFSVNRKTYVLKRQQSPNRIVMNGKEVNQKDVDDLFDFNIKLFSYMTVMSQFSGQFINATNAEKLDLFTKLLQLEKWNDYSEIAKNKTHEVSNELQRIFSEKERIEGKIEVLKDKNYDDLINEFEIKQFEIKEKLTDDAARLEEQLSRHIKDKTEAKKIYEENKEKYINLTKDFDLQGLTSIQDEIAEISKRQYEITFYGKEKRKSINAVKEENDKVINKFKKSGNTTCKECNQVVTKEHAIKQIKIIEIENNKKLSKLNEEIDSLIKEYNLNKPKQANLEQKEKEYNLTLKEINELEAKIELNENETISLDKMIEEASLHIKKYRDRYENQLKVENPYKKEKEKNELEISIYNKDYGLKQREYNELESKKNSFEFWIKAFKEIKLLITEESIDDFNLFCNNNLHKLGLEGWGIENSIDKVLKNKKIKKGFNTLITSIDNPNEVPLEVYSGGEIQRIKLALMLGLIDFLNNIIKINIEVYDEPTQWLDDKGIEYLLNLLKERSNSNCLYLIDHRNFKDSGYFDSVYEVLKINKESEINEV